MEEILAGKLAGLIRTLRIAESFDSVMERGRIDHARDDP